MTQTSIKPAPVEETIGTTQVNNSRSKDRAGKKDSSGKQVENLLAQIDILTQQKQHAENVLNQVLNSTSWRVTRPIRALSESLRSLRSLVRFRKVPVELEPVSHVSLQGNQVRVVGPSPLIRLKPIASAALPKGLVRVRARISAQSYPAIFILYYRTGVGFDANQRIWLRLMGNTKEYQTIYLPEGVRELRLAPFDTVHPVTIDALEFQEIGKAQDVGSRVAMYAKQALENPALLRSRLHKVRAILREGGLGALRARLSRKDGFTQGYDEWVKLYDTLTEKDREEIRAHIQKLRYQPKISVVLPLYNTPERWLRAAIESVTRQLYQNWELCIADDNSSDPTVRKIVEEYAAADPRITVVFRSTNGHIAEASNSAAALATGEFIGLLDHDDELTEHALYMVAHELNAYPQSDLIYSDEDKLTGFGLRHNPYFKSDWNPELLCAQNYVCHFTVVRSALFTQVGGFRSGFDGAQDWDLFLRIADATIPERIRHIPHILYHWRAIEGSTAQSTGAKPYVLEAQRRSVQEHLNRSGELGATVEVLESISHMRVRRVLQSPSPLVSLIIPTKDKVELLSRCVWGILNDTDYRNVEVIIVDNKSEEQATFDFFEEASRDTRVIVHRDDGPFNFSRLNNDAVKIAKGEILGFLNNDLEVIEPDWLSEMVVHAVRPQVGAVGARLLFPNGLLQHGGVILGIGGVAGHNHKGILRHDPGYFNRAILPQNLSAVTAACMLMRKDVFKEVGGFEEGALAVAFNDVDICLKIRSKGYLVTYTPYAELYHHESASRGYETTPEKFARFEGEIETMRTRWSEVLAHDPYYNPNLTLLSENFSFSFPSRAKKPWREFTINSVASPSLR
jgi:GT2 family glycosyltransferase